jgi:hypothetical protein
MEDGTKKDNTIHTYAEDVAKIIAKDTGSLVKKIIHAEEEREGEKKEESPLLKKNKYFMFISVSLLILSLIILFFFLFFKTDINTVPVEKQFVPIIFNDQYNYQDVLGLKKDDIAQMVLNQVNATQVKNGGIEGIYLTENKQMIGLRRFISLIKGNFVPGGSTLFVDDNFLMGVEKDELNSGFGARYGFFVLLKVRSIADVFDSMRAWENKIMTDLHGFLGIDISSDTNYLFQKNFEDGVVENKNARILYDKDGKLVMMYVFADDNSVVITNSLNAVHEVILRLVSSKESQ